LVLFSSLITSPWRAFAASSSWSVVFSPSPGGERNTLYAVAAVSDADAWAVGLFTNNDSTGPDYTLTEHWDGTAWTRVRSPSPFGAQNILFGVVAVSSNNVWAVGLGLDSFSSGGDVTLIEHWNGSRWTVVPSPSPGATNSDLRGVGRIGTSNRLWAVGSYDVTALGPGHTLVEKWDGSSWQAVASPGPLRGGWLEDAAPTSSSTDDWAVGGRVTASGNGTLAEHWNGSSWDAVSSPSVGNSYLTGVTRVPGSNHAWAVGTSVSGSQGFTERWDGSAWSLVGSPVPPGSTYYELQDVTSFGELSAWAVGSTQSNLSEVTLIEHWDGTSWTIVTSPNQGSGANALNAVARVPGTGHLWAVGEYFNGSATFGGSLIERYS